MSVKRPVLNSIWVPDLAIEWLDDWLKPYMTGVEFGSGCSTLWLSQRVKTLISVEHDEKWYERVKTILKEYNVKNVDLIYADTKINKKRYTQPLNKIPDETFDFSFVDGPNKLRMSSTVASWPKIKPRGILILDNSQEKGLREPVAYLNALTREKIRFRGPGTNPWNGKRNEKGWELSVWFKPFLKRESEL